MIRTHSKPALAVFAAFFVAIFIGILFSIKILLWPILIGFFIAFVLDPAVDFGESKGINRTVVIGMLFVVVFFLLLICIYVLVYPLFGQAQNMFSDLPDYLIMMKSQLREVAIRLQERFPQANWIAISENTINKAGSVAVGYVNSIPTFFTDLVGIVASAVIVPFVTFFILKDGADIKKYFIELIPNRYFEMALTLIYEVKEQITNYLRGMLLECGIISCLYVAGYGIIQVKYFVFLGIFAGICTLIPYLGPWIAGFAAVVVVLLDPTAVFPWWAVIIVVCVIQFVGDNFIYPVVMGRSINIHPLVIMFGLFVGGEVAGLVGMVVSIPVIAILKVISEVLYKGLKQYSII